MMALWMLGVWLVVVVSSAPTPTPNIVPAGLPTTQIGALRALYDATAGTGWKYDNPEAAWSFASSAKTQADPCLSRWAGVLCDSKNSSVIALDVNSMGLVGTLPEKIGALTALTYLDASYNSLSGTLPAGLFLLTMLLFCQIESNQLEGSLPADVGQLTALQILSLFDNKLEGTLSPAVGQLKALNELYLPYNSLSGSLPVELFGLTALQILSLKYNKFEGTLSPAVGQLKALNWLFLSVNSLSGSLPVELFELTELLELSLYSNNFEGTLSPAVGQLKALTHLDMESNSLSGSLPVALFELTELWRLSLHSNKFEGTLSSAVGHLKALTWLDLTLNSLSGSLPLALFELTELEVLSFFSNKFEGTLSPAVGHLKALTFLDLSINSLSGSLPVALFELTELQILGLLSNQFEGTLSPAVGQLKALTWLDLTLNSLSGSLPLALFELTKLKRLILDSNLFEGTLSPAVGQLKALTQLFLTSNSLSGSFPVALFELTALVELKLDKNQFSGSLPTINASMISFLKTLDVSNNALTGSPPLWLSAAPRLVIFSIANNSFSSSTLDFLPSANVTSVDISGNMLGGSLPAKIFRDSPYLEKFVAASNCLSGSVPLAICEATSLKTLILDGLSSGKRCTVPLFVPSQLIPHPGTKTLSKIRGGLPACLFTSLPKITTLHVSGNGLTGLAFPSDVSRWATALVDLSLSHNRLTGPISAELQSGLGQFKNFDVANNRLDGLLSNVKLSIATKANFIVNRFSGPLSKTLVAASDVQVLEGNLIACSSLNRNAQLPSKDPYLNRFSCGSNTFDISFAVFAALVFTFAAMAISWFRVSWLQIFQHIVGPAAAAMSSDDSIDHFIGALQRISRICACFIGTLLVVCVPAYAAVSSSFKTHSDLYSWSVSATFVGGLAPTAVFLVMWTILLIGWDWVLLARTWSKSSTKSKKSPEAIPHGLFSVAALKRTAAQVAVFTFNAFFVVIANILFVDVVKSGSSDHQKFASVALTLYKLLWNRVVLPFVIKQAERISENASLSSSSSSSQRSLLKLEFLLAAVNFVVAPAIALLTADSQCFGLAFSAPSPVTSSYEYAAGVDYARGKYDYHLLKWINPDIMATAYISYQPSFRYVYGCSAALVTTYASVFVNMALISCVAGPLCWVTVRNLIDREWLSKDFGARVLPALIQTSQERRIRRGKQGDRAHLSYNIIDTHKIFLEVLQDLIALHTFGLVAPMCGLTIAVALIVKMLKYRYALEQFRSTQPPEDVEVLLTDCRDFSQQMHPFVETHPLILLLSSLFLSAFLFDIAGDAVGWKAAMWAPALMWTLPLLLSLLRARFFASTSVACSSLIAAFPVPGEVELPSVHLDVGNDGSLGDLYGSGGDGGGDDKDDSRFSGTMLEARASSTLAPARASSSMDAAAAAAIVVDEHSDSSMAFRLSHAHPPPLLALHLHPAARLSTVPVEPPVSEVSSP